MRTCGQIRRQLLDQRAGLLDLLVPDSDPAERVTGPVGGRERSDLGVGQIRMSGANIAANGDYRVTRPRPDTSRTSIRCTIVGLL